MKTLPFCVNLLKNQNETVSIQQIPPGMPGAAPQGRGAGAAGHGARHHPTPATKGGTTLLKTINGIAALFRCLSEAE